MSEREDSKGLFTAALPAVWMHGVNAMGTASSSPFLPWLPRVQMVPADTGDCRHAGGLHWLWNQDRHSPRSAFAKLACRLVPGQDPAGIFKKASCLHTASLFPACDIEEPRC